MADQSTPIQIQGWQRGIGSSPYVGFGNMVGLDIFRKPGIIQNEVALTALVVESAALTGMITCSAGQFYGTNDGKVYMNGLLLETTDAPIHDMIIVGNYLIVSKANTTLDLYQFNPVGGVYEIGGLTTLLGKTLNTSVYGYKKMLMGQDGVIYIGNESQLASIIGINQNPTFPADWTLNTSCLSTGVPYGQIIQTICELNRYIAISTSLGAGFSGNTKLYFMDRGLTNGTGTGFYLSIGVDIPERLVTQMIAQNNNLYFFGNDTGSVYTTNTTQYKVVAVIPGRLPTQNYITYQNAVAIIDNEILFGVGGVFNSVYITTYGVYSFRDGSLITKAVTSNGQTGNTANLNIGCIYAYQNGSYQVGWNTGTTYGIDQATTLIGTGYVESPFYQTASALAPRTFQTVQWDFAENLYSSQSIQFYYRLSTESAWILYTTYSYSGTTLTTTYASGAGSGSVSNPAINHFTSKFAIAKTTNLQLKIVLNPGATPYGSNIQLKSVTLI